MCVCVCMCVKVCVYMRIKQCGNICCVFRLFDWKQIFFPTESFVFFLMNAIGQTKTFTIKSSHEALNTRTILLQTRSVAFNDNRRLFLEQYI